MGSGDLGLTVHLLSGRGSQVGPCVITATYCEVNELVVLMLGAEIGTYRALASRSVE